MENAEEVMQLLEEFTKMRPKEIPKELEDYLCYVAKTGDPVYQWSVVKNLFREKLIKVITDFFESTLTVELPPCPNVEPFNYDRMKNSLLERFDTFNSAPFTVQRICELLTNPRKEYNRADKYMRAIEKNILVVSTREPGSGKRQSDIDSQQETILNGMPDVKVNEYDGSLMHVPTDLPYLGAPPASNVVTVETSEPIFVDNVNERIGFGVDMNEESKTDNNKSWVTQEPSVSVLENEHAGSTSELLDVEETLSSEKSEDKKDCNADSRFIGLENCPSNSGGPNIEAEGESGPDVLILKNEIIVSDDTSIDSSDSNVVLNNLTAKPEESSNSNDENEVSSTPTSIDIVAEALILEEVDVSLNSEAEATDSSTDQNLQSVGKLSNLTEGEINTSSERVIKPNETDTIVTITEVSGSNDSDEIGVECSDNEITGTIDSPESPPVIISSESTDAEKSGNSDQFIIQETEQPDLHPDSSNDVSTPKELSLGSLPTEEPLKLDTAVLEPDSLSETDESVSKPKKRKSDVLDESVITQKDSETSHCSSSPSGRASLSLNLNVVEETCEKPLKEAASLPSSSVEHTTNSENEAVCSEPINEVSKIASHSNTAGVTEVMYDQEQREESVIQTLPNVPSESLKEIPTLEDISVDPGCEEEEAMDVDDGSNQMMMVTEGENEGEPMDQSDQLQC